MLGLLFTFCVTIAFVSKMDSLVLITTEYCSEKDITNKRTNYFSPELSAIVILIARFLHRDLFWGVLYQNCRVEKYERYYYFENILKKSIRETGP